MSRSPFWISIACLGLSAATDPATAGTESETGALVLQIPPTARALAMGMAQVAIADDASAVFWNPAALAFMPGSQSAAATYTDLPTPVDDSLEHAFAGFASTMHGVGMIAGSVTYLRWPESPLIDFSGNVRGKVRPYELVPGVALGVRLSETTGVGFGFKVVRSDFGRVLNGPDLEATTVAIDGGVLWWSREDRLRFGLNVQNLGPGLEFRPNEVSDPLPRNVKVGVGWTVVDLEQNTLVVAADINKPLLHAGDGPILNLGGELSVGGYLAVRFGWVYEGWYQERGPISDPTYGFGLRIFGVSFDYASAPFGVDENLANRFSLGARF